MSTNVAHRVVAASVVAVCLTALAACEGTLPDERATLSPPLPTTVGPTRAQISEPLSLGAYQARPCSVLSRRQIARFGFDRAKEATYLMEPEPYCYLRTGDDPSDTAISLQLKGATPAMWRDEGGPPGSARSTSVSDYPAMSLRLERDPDHAAGVRSVREDEGHRGSGDHQRQG